MRSKSNLNPKPPTILHNHEQKGISNPPKPHAPICILYLEMCSNNNVLRPATVYARKWRAIACARKCVCRNCGTTNRIWQTWRRRTLNPRSQISFRGHAVKWMTQGEWHTLEDINGIILGARHMKLLKFVCSFIVHGRQWTKLWSKSSSACPVCRWSGNASFP